jgi:hypothetical protein
MKLLRYLAAIVLMCGLSAVAKADDFQMVVIDPFTGPYSINPISTNAFSFGFAECEEPGQVPAGSTFDGCFTGQNETGAILTSLQMTIPVFDDQTAGCSPSGTGLDLFSDVTCGENSSDTDYILSFSGGSITEGEIFTVAETGVAPEDFPDVAVVANAPEPASIWLLATGLLMSGVFFVDWRRRNVQMERP